MAYHVGAIGFERGDGRPGAEDRSPCTTSVFSRMWEYFLAGGIVMFESGAACNYQVQYIRDRNALPITRDYMAKAEERLRNRD